MKSSQEHNIKNQFSSNCDTSNSQSQPVYWLSAKNKYLFTPPFNIIRFLGFFLKLHVSRRVSVCHFGPHFAHVIVSKSNYNI
jgi:hypothetical protein